MSGSPTVSVVIPVLNGAATIADTLTGLMHQADAPEVEVLVVDNGSTDTTREVVRKFPVTLLTEPTPGPAAARNCGLRAARGAVVAHLDADTLPTLRWLAEITAPFADARLIQVAGRLLGFRPSTPVERYYARSFFDREEEHTRAEGFPFAASANMACRRDAALAVGGWDETFRVSQDVDFSYRLGQRFEVPIHYQPGALVFVRGSRTLSELKQQAFKYGQGRAWLWSRYPEVVRWGPRRAARVARSLAMLAVRAEIVRAAYWAGYATETDLQDAKYDRAWNWSLWRGFASMARHREWC